MGVTGGVCMCLLSSINQRCKKASLPKKCILGSAVITGMELVVGCIVNRKLKWNVWDYSDMPGNLWGQVCPQFAAAWLVLSWAAVKLENLMHKWLDSG